MVKNFEAKREVVRHTITKTKDEIKTVKKDKDSNTFQKLRRNQILPIVLALGFMIFLIVDLIRYYNQ